LTKKLLTVSSYI